MIFQTESLTEKKTLKNGNPRHVLSKADRVKGGKSKTFRRRVSDGMRTRKYCTKSCPIYHDCWAKELITFDKRFTDKSTGKYLCALKHFSNNVQKNTINLLLKGEEGIKSLLKGLVIRLLVHSKLDNVKDLGRLLHDVGYVYTLLYSHKKRIVKQANTNKGESLSDFVNRIKENELKEQRVKQ